MAYSIEWLRRYEELLTVLVFAAGYAESIVLVGMFVPSSIIFAGVGAVYASSHSAFLPLWIAGALGAVLGDTTSFAVGRYFRADIAKTWPVSHYPRHVARGEFVFKRWGWLAIILGKFAWGVRPFISIVAGIVAMPTAHFLLISAISGTVWAAISLGVGYAGFEAYQAIFP